MAKLYFYYSTMNAGKTTHLLQANYNYCTQDKVTVLLTPLIDKRFGTGIIRSRIGIEAPAIVFDELMNLYDKLLQLQARSKNIACVFVDEAQFLTRNQVLELTEVVDSLSLPVMTYGLRTDFRGDLFVGSAALLASADELVELKTICHCGRKAIMTQRIDANQQRITSGAQIEVGGNERYMAVCRRHFK